jgi:hypothetical protein
VSKFQVGDKVRCIDNKDIKLEKDKIYTVSNITSNAFISVEEYAVKGSGFYAWRFEKVPEEPKFKVGSKAWSPSYGWGQVKESKHAGFPIYVTFRNMGMVYYTAEGKTLENSPLPTLFLSEVSASDWPNPPAKVDPSTFVADQDLEVKLSSHGVWILAKFAILKNGEVWVFGISYDSKSAEIMYKVVDFRLPIAQKGV